MRKIIHHLRNQSEERKRHILHLSTAFFAFILIALWVVSLGGGLRASVEEDLAGTQTANPLSAISENLVEGYESITSDDGYFMLP